MEVLGKNTRNHSFVALHTELLKKFMYSSANNISNIPWLRYFYNMWSYINLLNLSSNKEIPCNFNFCKILVLSWAISVENIFAIWPDGDMNECTQHSWPELNGHMFEPRQYCHDMTGSLTCKRLLAEDILAYHAYCIHHLYANQCLILLYVCIQ